MCRAMGLVHAAAARQTADFLAGAENNKAQYDFFFFPMSKDGFFDKSFGVVAFWSPQLKIYFLQQRVIKPGALRPQLVDCY